MQVAHVLWSVDILQEEKSENIGGPKLFGGFPTNSHHS